MKMRLFRLCSDLMFNKKILVEEFCVLLPVHYVSFLKLCKKSHIYFEVYDISIYENEKKHNIKTKTQKNIPKMPYNLS